MSICANCSNPVNKNDKICPYCDNIIDIAYTATTANGSASAAASNQVTSIMRRYQDAYLVARVTDGFGGLIKAIGIIAALLLIVVGALVIANGRPGDAIFAMGVMIVAFGIFVGSLFYLLGVLVSAQGQILKASLDGAVNNSPFLTNEHRARIMSLPLV
jgi:hypothetical protein